MDKNPLLEMDIKTSMAAAVPCRVEVQQGIVTYTCTGYIKLILCSPSYSRLGFAGAFPRGKLLNVEPGLQIPLEML